MIVALSVIHIAIAAAWFGHKLLLPGEIRRSVGGEPNEARLLVDRLKHAERLGIVTGLGTVVSGGLLLWAVGVETVGPGVWVGLGLALCAMVLGATIARPASQRLAKSVANGDRVGATIAGTQISRTLGMESLLWMGALVSMVI